VPLDHFLEVHSASLTIVVLTALVLATLLLIVPQLLRTHLQTQHLRHEQVMRALEHGHPLPTPDERTRFAGRTAVLVPMASIISAGAVTCFVAAYKVESLFSVALAVWTVSGVASLAAITGGVALMTRLAGLPTLDEAEEPAEEEPVGSDRQ
jgi:hypothetical protein